ncbi:MAG: GNAT family N-acetyltransferase [Clostridium sp.]
MESKLLTKEEFLLRIEEFQRLFNICFQRSVSKEYLIWRYLSNSSDDFLMNVALDEGEIVANYSLSPTNLIINEKEEKFALSMTTMTNPKYGGRGIFKRLAVQLYEEVEKLGYFGVYGFPNKNSHGIFIRDLGWKDVYEIPTLSLNLKNLREGRIVEDNRIVTRGARFIKSKIWRYDSNPVNKYEYYNLFNIFGEITYKIYNNNEIDIIEIDYKTINDGERLLLEFCKVMKKRNIIKINMWYSIYNPLHGFIEKIGFENTEPITYFSIKLFKRDCGLEDYRKWEIQMGDSDVY